MGKAALGRKLLSLQLGGNEGEGWTQSEGWQRGKYHIEFERQTTSRTRSNSDLGMWIQIKEKRYFLSVREKIRTESRGTSERSCVEGNRRGVGSLGKKIGTLKY